MNTTACGTNLACAVIAGSTVTLTGSKRAAGYAGGPISMPPTAGRLKLSTSAGCALAGAVKPASSSAPVKAAVALNLRNRGIIDPPAPLGRGFVSVLSGVRRGEVRIGYVGVHLWMH